jgi:hypothetical protein
MRGWEVSNHRRRKDKESESSIDLAAHDQIFKQQKQLAILLSTSKNTLSFLLLLMSTHQQNWRNGQNRFCLDLKGVGGEREGVGDRGRGKNGPNNVCIYE